jgi:hypothetical protein
LHNAGKLNRVQDRFFHPKPTAELYDLASDPHMINNLAEDPQYAEVKERLHRRLVAWQLETRDLGLLSEYEMHKRSADSTPYEVGQNREAYPLEEILPVADLASQRDPGNLNRLVDLLEHDEPVVRWWATLGLVMLGEQSRSATAPLRGCLHDASPLVRVAAAEALYQLGDVELARTSLIDALGHETPFVRLRALNVLSRMGEDARPALPAIRDAAMPKPVIHPGEYANRMVEYLPLELSRHGR